jgi:hypothetical protein
MTCAILALAHSAYGAWTFGLLFASALVVLLLYWLNDRSL